MRTLIASATTGRERNGRREEKRRKVAIVNDGKGTASIIMLVHRSNINGFGGPAGRRELRLGVNAENYERYLERERERDADIQTDGQTKGQMYINPRNIKKETEIQNEMLHGIRR
jgi:hypothetical protein